MTDRRLIYICLFLSLNASLEASNAIQNKTQLQQLDKKITNLRLTLSDAQDKNNLLHQKLAVTEKEISASMQQLHETQLETLNKQQQILTLKNDISTLHKQLHKQQVILAKQLRAQYMLDESQPLKWLLNQENTELNHRTANYYLYITQEQQKNINKIQLTDKQLCANQAELHKKYEEEKKLQEQLLQHQKKLEQNKIESHTILQSLNQDIQNNQQALTVSLQNKNNLTKLVSSLAQKSILMTQNPLLYKKKKLQRPVAFKGNSVKKQNQGVVFLVAEGTPVNAVYSGTVVFSDWLKGYGLLLIIDHGQGFMTLYARNQSLLKQKGDTVVQGMQIAAVGHTGGLKENGLYFEIRQYGKAIPPLKWLGS